MDHFIPTRVVFGNGRLEELKSVALPGKKALLCVLRDGFIEPSGLMAQVIGLLAANGVEVVINDHVMPNPTREDVMKGVEIARREGCDFCVGLGGGSTIDTAKAVAIMLKNPGDLWEYANTGSGGRKEISSAAPVVAISTTAGTGTETDPYCVITNEKTGEKLDFAVDAIFPQISFIDPQITTSLPRHLTIYQGFDAFFHAAECYIVNQNKNKLVDMYGAESVRLVTKWLPAVAEDGKNEEARTNIMFAADVLSGYTQALINTTSHHIIGQCLGGLFPKLPHGASLIILAEAYYKKIKALVPDMLEQLGTIMGEPSVAGDVGQNFINGLVKMLDITGVRELPLSEYGMERGDFERVADIVVDDVGIDSVDIYELTKNDIIDILTQSYR
ncbi:MAG: iron-containing alcohol dehydrogenase [Christensenella sp.]|nr:iron-containing alcohol dehydrogenase [Christensenella sp.]MEA5003398.1 iron-containing alcohol dehydrogenase [Christensenella sp.]